MITVYWMTCRSANDLCFTTHQAFLNGLMKRGCDVVLVNPDEPGLHNAAPWSHIHVPSSTIPGLSARSVGKEMIRWAKEHVFEKTSVAVIDWRVSPRLAPFFSLRNIAWTMLDRSPPAHAGLLSRLQWPGWKRAWKQVGAAPEGLGFVVSEAHSHLVKQHTGTSMDKMVVLPAGVDLDLFQPGLRRPRFTLVYHGRLDKNRGVLALPMLLQKARQANLEADLVLIGTGDAVPGLKRIAQDMKGLELHPSMPQQDLAEVLSTCHVGLLPMPKTQVWSVASPLKQCEYAASGLPMLGIDHEGHRLGNHHHATWLKLMPQEDFFVDGVEWLNNLQAVMLDNIADAVRTVAEQELSWEHPVDALHSALLEVASSS